MTDAWEHFVSGLSPTLLQQELARVHGDLEQERFGSRSDLEMRFAHDFIRFQAAARAAESAAERQARILRVQEADADREIRARGFGLDADDHDIEAAIRSYSQRQAATAAERRTAA